MFSFIQCLLSQGCLPVIHSFCSPLFCVCSMWSYELVSREMDCRHCDSPLGLGVKSLFSRGCVYFPPLFMGVLYGCCLTLFLWILYLNCHFTRLESPLRDTNVLEKTLITVSFCSPFFDHRTAMRQVLLLLLLSIEKHCTGKRELRYNWLLSSHCNNFASGKFCISLILHNNGPSIAKIKHSQSTEGITERHSSVLLTFIKNNK